MTTKQGYLSCTWIDGLHPEILNLIYWKSPLHSGAVLVAGMSLLLSMEHLSFVSVMSYTCLTILCCAAGWKITHELIGSFKKSDPNAPSNSKNLFQNWLNADVTIPQDKIHDIVSAGVSKCSNYLNHLRRVFALENYVETAKFAFTMYIFTIIGNWFNLLTLVMLCFIGLFTWPKIYSLYQPQIDDIFVKLRSHVNALIGQIKEKTKNLPIFASKKNA